MILENKDWQNTLKNGLNKIHYTYSLKNDFHVDISQQNQVEREPSRILEIQDAKLYKGELSKQGSMNWINTDKVWIVNGHVEKTDANFFKDFSINEVLIDNISAEIQEGKIFMGATPETEIDTIVLQ